MQKPPGPDAQARLRETIKTQFDLEVLLKRTEHQTIRERRKEVEGLLQALQNYILRNGQPRERPVVAAAPPSASTLFSLTRDGHFVQWRCPVCLRQSFSGIGAVRQHCRQSHRLDYQSRVELFKACTVPVVRFSIARVGSVFVMLLFFLVVRPTLMSRWTTRAGPTRSPMSLMMTSSEWPIRPPN